MNIHTILFDLDGTLIDTNELIVASFKHTFAQFDLQFTEEEIVQFNGPPLIETFSKINPLRAEEMVATYRTHNHKVHDDYVVAFPQVVETLETLKANNIRMSVVTSKMRDGVELGLKKTGIRDYFEAIVTVDDVVNPKPHPEPVLKALQQLEANQEHTIMVGDNSHDILAGKNAGIRTAGVSWSQKGKDYLLNYEPTYMLEDMSDLLKIVGV